MPEEGYKHKLAAILSADVVGYSRLMAEDEVAPIRNLNHSHEWLTLPRQELAETRFPTYRFVGFFHH